MFLSFFISLQDKNINTIYFFKHEEIEKEYMKRVQILPIDLQLTCGEEVRAFSEQNKI